MGVPGQRSTLQLLLLIGGFVVVHSQQFPNSFPGGPRGQGNQGNSDVYPPVCRSVYPLMCVCVCVRVPIILNEYGMILKPIELSGTKV